MGRSRTLAPAALSALLVVAGAGPARAEKPHDPTAAEARARALATEANDLLAEAKVEEACRKLAESEALVPSAATLQQLAACEEAEGKLAKALMAYRQLTVLAGRSLRGSREQAIRARVQRLEASVPRLVVRVSAETVAVTGLEVKACGAILGEGELGLPLPEDPGPCEVTAHAPGKAVWTKTIELGARGTRAEVVVPALDPESPAAPAPEASTAPAPAPEPPAEPPPPPPPTGPATERRITGIALVGIGVALGGTGAYFAYAGNQSRQDANGLCPAGTTCTNPESFHDTDRAHTEVLLSNLVLGAAAVALVTGIVVLATQPSQASHATAATWLQPSRGGFALGAAF